MKELRSHPLYIVKLEAHYRQGDDTCRKLATKRCMAADKAKAIEQAKEVFKLELPRRATRVKMFCVGLNQVSKNPHSQEAVINA